LHSFRPNDWTQKLGKVAKGVNRFFVNKWRIEELRLELSAGYEWMSLSIND